MYFKKQTVLLFIFFGLGILVLISVYSKSEKQSKNTDESINNAAATPAPFAELTIPYLRNRTYTSALGPLEQVIQNSAFTSYLTQYDSDGNRINALVTKPSGTPPADGWPAIVFVHGYIPPAEYKTLEKYVEYVNSLARNGFVVFKIDLRGHGSSEGIATGSYYSSAYVIDTLNAIAALQASEFVNKKSIGLWGHSMAGNIVLRSMAVQPTIPAAVIWAGAGFSYEDLQKYGLNDNSYRRPNPSTQPQSDRQRLFTEQGMFNPDSLFWKEVAATNYVRDFKGAVQLHHAEDDTTVSSNYTKDLAMLLKTTEVPHESYLYSSGGHNISGANFTVAMQRTIDFYKKYLSGE